MQQQDGDSLSGSLWKAGNGIVYQAESSPVCFVQASLKPLLCLGDNICLLFPALLPACCSAGDGPGLWRFIILSEGLLDKRSQHPPLCRGDMAARDEENVRESHCSDLARPAATPGLDILYRGGDILAEP